MTTDRPRRLAAAASIVVLGLGLTACGTGGNAATSQQYQPGIGANVRVGDVQLYNALLVRNDDGTLSFSAGIVNTTDTAQTLESATFSPLSGSETVRMEPTTDVEVAPGELFTIGTAGELAGIEGEAFEQGRYVVVTLTFSGAGDVAIEAPSVERTEMYSSVAAEPAEQPADDDAVDAEVETETGGADDAAPDGEPGE